MPADPRYFESVQHRLKQMVTHMRTHGLSYTDSTVLTRTIDAYLEEWYDVSTRATEYDGAQWGFNPDRWMYRERLSMGRVPMRKHDDGRWYPYP